MVFGIEFVDKVLKIDDPVGAIGVHAFCGATGTLLTGLFAYYLTDDAGNPLGLFYGGGFSFLGTQALGVVSVIAWVAVTMTIVFTVIKKTVGLRASREEEVRGLDVTEHNLVSSYADFLPMPPQVLTGETENATSVLLQNHDSPSAAPAIQPAATEAKLTKLSILCRQESFSQLKEAMNAIGVTGMTVTQVLGYGLQKGRDAYYRGVKLDDAKLLPKVKVEIVVSKVPVETVIEAAREALTPAAWETAKSSSTTWKTRFGSAPENRASMLCRAKTEPHTEKPGLGKARAFRRPRCDGSVSWKRSGTSRP